MIAPQMLVSAERELLFFSKREGASTTFWKKLGEDSFGLS